MSKGEQATEPGALVDLTAREALPLLLERYGDKLYRLGIRVCRTEDEAADLLQDVFVIALRKWDQFEGRSEPSSWLYTIAVRACRRRHRRRAGEPAEIPSLEELLPSGDSAVPAPPEEDDPLDSVLRKETIERVDAAISGLPVEYRLPLVLKELAGLSVAEVAEILDLPEGTVKTRLHRGRLKLREVLVEDLPTRETPPPDHSREVCLDLLQAKQEALDRGVEFPVHSGELCSRCESLFATLDLTQEVCQRLGRNEMPPRVRSLVDRRLASESSGPS